MEEIDDILRVVGGMKRMEECRVVIFELLRGDASTKVGRWGTRGHWEGSGAKVAVGDLGKVPLQSTSHLRKVHRGGLLSRRVVRGSCKGCEYIRRGVWISISNQGQLGLQPGDHLTDYKLGLLVAGRRPASSSIARKLLILSCP